VKVGLDYIIVIEKVCLLRKECSLIKIKPILWCKPCQNLLASFALSLNCQCLLSLPLHVIDASEYCKSCKMSAATLLLKAFPFLEPETRPQTCCVSLIT